MDEKISHSAVEQYSAAFAEKVAERFFSEKTKITGPEILSLCEVRQVNLFTIHELLKVWRQEITKLRSPFFDYQAEEVKTALTTFQNTLSNHISISRDHFIPILRKAVEQTIFLILDPYDFYSDTLEKHGKQFIRVDELRNDIKYLKINEAPLLQLVQHLTEKKLDIIAGNEAFALLDHILEEVNFTPQDVEPFFAKLSEVLPVSIDKLYERKEVKPVKKKNTPVAQSEKVAATVADNFQKILSIRESLTINQKFMFTKMLFSGDFDLFSQAIDKLDQFDNLQQAVNFLELNYSEWDRESEEFEEFMELVEKRFS